MAWQLTMSLISIHRTLISLLSSTRISCYLLDVLRIYGGISDLTNSSCPPNLLHLISGITFRLVAQTRDLRVTLSILISLLTTLISNQITPILLLKCFSICTFSFHCYWLSTESLYFNSWSPHHHSCTHPFSLNFCLRNLLKVKIHFAKQK